MEYSLPDLLCPCDSPGKNTGVRCHALLQGIFSTQGLNSTSPMSSEGGFFTTSTNWEAHNLVFLTLYIVGCGWGRFPSSSTFATWMNGLPGGSDSKESSCNVRDQGLTLGKKWQGERNGNLLQYSFLENPMDRGAWRALVPGVTKSQM